MREPDLASGRVLGLLVPFLVGLAVYQGVLIQLQMRLGSGGDGVQAAEVLAAYEATPHQSIPIHPDNPSLGPEQALAELVVFSDFQCPACAEFAVALEELRHQFDSGLRVVFKHYPLDDACNPAMTEPFHEQACEAARLAQAANEAGAFWPAHDALFGLELSGSLESVVQAVAGAAGMNADTLRQRMNDPEIETAVSRDIQEGIKLGLPGTPSVFLNGRLLSDKRPSVLRLLLVHLLKVEGSASTSP